MGGITINKRLILLFFFFTKDPNVLTYMKKISAVNHPRTFVYKQFFTEILNEIIIAKFEIY